MARVVIAITAATFILFLPPRAPSHSPDIQHYLYAANALIEHDDWLNKPGLGWVGYYYTERAPLYPLILAAFQRAGLDAYTASHGFNATLYGLLAYLLLGWAGRYKWLTALLLFMPPLFFTFTATWAEPPTVLLTALFVHEFQQARPRRMGLYAAVALLLKYSAAPLVLFGFVWLLAVKGPRAAWRFVVWPVVAIAPWMLRNTLLVGSPFGLRLGAKYTWAYNAQVLGETLGLWIGLILIGVVVQWCVGLWWQRRSLSPSPPRLSSSRQARA